MSLISFELTTSENENYLFRIKKVSQEFCSPKKRAENRIRDYYSLHFVMYGSGILKVNGEENILSQGSAFLLYAGEQYEYYPDHRNPWSYVWIDLNGENLDKFFEQAGFSREKPFVKIQRMDEMMSLLRDLHETYFREVFSDMTYYGYFMMILDRLLKNNKNLSTYNVGNILRYKQVREMLIYINNNYRLDITPTELTEVFNVSYRTLMRIFNEEIGMSPMEYLANFRISMACEMFARNGSYSVNEVAEACGYSDPLYFSRVFKKKKGVSPSQYIAGHDEDHPFEWLKEKNIDLR